ncbi:hypothetical protein [Amycolatopsis sp. WQ 127309]|uniref:hypothetical protein n=1 Tax=Amycolatopsis sp. WQ 127309 TaxID=2932773 RepID=UPI001FF17E6D|nr:hypothetical protein [Amycolatopsis sp. WQ 127309]UOZ04641.1 hypothetical protein MUY22_38290 [Amycolatopsis sp. WQ 127309]
METELRGAHKMKLRTTIVSVAVAAATVFVMPTAAVASAGTGSYCVQDLAGGPKACFTTERALESYQAKLSLSPLLTVFDNTGWSGAGGYLNFVSAYGRTYCDAAKDKNEASEGNLGVRQFSTGLSAAGRISSYVIKAGSGCFVTFWDQTGFNGTGVTWNQNCDDMARCFGPYFDNRAHSLAVT